MDPVAGAFQNYGDEGLYRDQYLGLDSLPDSYRFVQDGVPLLYQDGDSWYRDMLAPGLGDELAPDAASSLQWLAASIVQDERFAIAAVEFWWQAVMGVDVILPPEESTDIGFAEQLAAYEDQRATILILANGFRTGTTSKGAYNLKDLLVEMIMTSWFRASSKTGSDTFPEVALADAGTGRLLTPNQLSRKTAKTTGFTWGNRYNEYLRSYSGNLSDQYRLYYGGIDSDGIIKRSEDITSLMAAVAQSHAFESACPIIMHEYLLADVDRLLFSGVDRNTTPLTDENAIKRQLVRLHERMLGEMVNLDGPEIKTSYQLLVDTWQSKQGSDIEFPGNTLCNWSQDQEFFNGLVNTPIIIDDEGFRDFNYDAINAFLSTTDMSDSNQMLKTWVVMMVYFMTDYRYLYI